jgi:hypothetical protein
MRDRRGRIRSIAIALIVGAALGYAPARAASPLFKVDSLSAGFGFENFSRTVFWKGDDASSKLLANLFCARADLGLRGGAVVSFSAGFVLTDYKSLTFNDLPVALQLDARPLAGFSLGAEAVVPVRRWSDFEISGTGRIVYSFGMSKTWTLEDFAVPGKATGQAGWFEAAAGPRLSYLVFGRIVPYLEVWCRWLHAGFKMNEALEDLTGTQTRRVPGNFSFSAALGADAAVTSRVSVRAKAGFRPYSGGVDGLFSFGVLYKF